MNAAIAKMNAWLQAKYDGDPKRAFDAYADADGKLSRAGIIRILDDVGINTILPHGVLATLAIAKCDTDNDGKISWPEAQAAMKEYQPSRR